MPCSLVYTITKPADKPWFNKHDPATAADYIKFVRTYPGVLAWDHRELVPDIQWMSTMVFENEMVKQSFLRDALLTDCYLKRQAYLREINAFVTMKELG